MDQTFTDWKLIVADNASSDRTEEIARHFAATDRRIVYHRHPKDLGAAPNFNWTFRQATGRYFKWSAHDDLIHSRFLERCIETLERDSCSTLAHARVAVIDADGEVLETGPLWPEFSALEPHRRIRGVLKARILRSLWPVFGVMRTEALRGTKLHGSYTGSDTTLMMELATRGPFVQIPEVLFYSREHVDRSINIWRIRGGRGHPREAWFDTRRRGKVTFPSWQRVRQMFGAIARSGLRAPEAISCYWVLTGWLMRSYWKSMVRDLFVAGRQLLDLPWSRGGRPAFRRRRSQDRGRPT